MRDELKETEDKRWHIKIIITHLSVKHFSGDKVIQCGTRNTHTTNRENVKLKRNHNYETITKKKQKSFVRR